MARWCRSPSAVCCDRQASHRQQLTLTLTLTLARHSAVKFRHLADLGSHWKLTQVAAQQIEHERAEVRRQEQVRLRAQQAQRDVFARTVGPVHPLPDHHLAETLADTHAPRPSADPRQRQLDEAAALRESLSDEMTLETLLLTDDGLSFRRPGIGADVVTRLRRGQWALQGQIDLHGLNRDQARDALATFVREAHQRGMRCLRVVHGKGHGSPGRQSVLKEKVQRWLAQRSEVIAFAQATGPQGGAGALLVLLAGLGRA